MRKHAIFSLCLLFGACSSTGTGTPATTPQDSGANTSVRTDVKTDSGVAVTPESGVPPVTKPDASPDRMTVVVPDTRPAAVPDTAPIAVPDAEVPVDLQPVVPDPAPSPVVDADVPQVPDVAPVVDLAPVVPDLAPAVPDLQVASLDAFSPPDKPPIVPDTAPELKLDAIVQMDLKPATPDTSTGTRTGTSTSCGALESVCCATGPSACPIPSVKSVCVDTYGDYMPARFLQNGVCKACGMIGAPPCLQVNGQFVHQTQDNVQYWCMYGGTDTIVTLPNLQVSVHVCEIQ
jgi:hypothetical protein